MMTQHSQFSNANLYSEQPPTRKITLKVILYIVLALLSIVLWIHNLFVPSLPGNWLWISVLFILGIIVGLGSMVFSNFKKWWPNAQNSQEQREMAGSLVTSQWSFSLLIWLCSILEMALIAVVVVMQFNGTANAKGLSESLLSGALVSLLTWLAYRAYRYIDW